MRYEYRISWREPDGEPYSDTDRLESRTDARIALGWHKREFPECTDYRIERRPVDLPWEKVT